MPQPTEPHRSRTIETAMLGVTAAAVLLMRWIAQLPSSLWIDELGTYWVISEDLATTADRAWTHHGQTPLYYGALWLWTQLFGTSEAALRSLSVVAMAGAAWLVYRLTIRWFGRSAAVLSTMAFIAVPEVATHAGDARPYAFALLAALLAGFALDRVVRRPGWAAGAVFGLSAALIVYVHYVAATVLVGHALFAVWLIAQRPDERAPFVRSGVGAIVAFAAAVAPTVPQMSALLGRRDELTFTPLVTLDMVTGVWAIPILTVTLLVLVTWRLARPDPTVAALDPVPTVLVATAAAAPPVVLFALASGADVVLWADRYWLVAVPYLAMLFGAVASSFTTTRTQVVRVAAAVGLLSILTMTRSTHSVENWQTAVAHVNQTVTADDTPVLLHPNLIELTSEGFLDDPIRRDYARSVAAYYPMEGTVEALPGLDGGLVNPAWIDPHLEAAAVTSDDIIVIGGRNQGLRNHSYISGWFSATGWDIESTRAFSEILVIHYRR